MKIIRISAFQMDIPLYESCYAWSGENLANEFNGYVTNSITNGTPQRREGLMQCAARPQG